MSSAKEFALEQADLVAQLAKYSDRLLVIESSAAPERRAFTKLVDDRLPATVHLVTLKAAADSHPDQLLQLVAEQMQLSPGIESPEQLVTAINEALTGQDKVLVVIEDADQWQDSDAWSRLLEYIQTSHDLASRHLLFMLTGAPGLGGQLATEPQLLDVQGDMHLCSLPDDAIPESGTAPAASEDELLAEPEANAAVHQPPRHHRRFNPTLLIVAGISVVVVTVGGFALLSRSGKSPEPKMQSVQIKPEHIKPAQPETSASQPPAMSGQDASVQPPAVAQGNTAPTTSGGMSGATTTNQTAPSTTASEPKTAMNTQSPATASAQSTNPAPVPQQPAATENLPTTAQPATEPQPKPAAQPSKPAQAESAPTAQPKAKQPNASVKTGTAKTDNGWYQHKPRARAVVQLAAFDSRHSAENFIGKHGGSGKMAGDHWHIFTQKPHGKVLYTVTVGDYPSAERARHAIKSLPSALRKLKPYPRTIGSIQDVIAP